MTVPKFVSDRMKLFYGTLCASVLPWVLCYLFAWAKGIPSPNPIFYAITLTLDLPFVGNGYWYPFIAWGIAGLFVGYVTGRIKLTFLADFLGIIINLALYIGAVFTLGGINPDYVDPMVNPVLYGTTMSSASVVALFIQLFYRSLAVPALLMFSIWGKRIIYGYEGKPPRQVVVKGEQYFSRIVRTSPALKAYQEQLARSNLAPGDSGAGAPPGAPPSAPPMAPGNFASPTQKIGQSPDQNDEETL